MRDGSGGDGEGEGKGKGGMWGAGCVLWWGCGGIWGIWGIWGMWGRVGWIKGWCEEEAYARWGG